MSCDHELEIDYIYPGDIDVLKISDDNGSLEIALVMPCPNCGQSLRLDTTISSVEEIAMDLPLDDEIYD